MPEDFAGPEYDDTDEGETAQATNLETTRKMLNGKDCDDEFNLADKGVDD